MARIFQHMALLIFVSLGETVAGSVISWHRSPVLLGRHMKTDGSKFKETPNKLDNPISPSIVLSHAYKSNITWRVRIACDDDDFVCSENATIRYARDTDEDGDRVLERRHFSQSFHHCHRKQQLRRVARGYFLWICRWTGSHFYDWKQNGYSITETIYDLLYLESSYDPFSLGNCEDNIYWVAIIKSDGTRSDDLVLLKRLQCRPGIKVNGHHTKALYRKIKSTNSVHLYLSFSLKSYEDNGYLWIDTDGAGENVFVTGFCKTFAVKNPPGYEEKRGETFYQRSSDQRVDLNIPHPEKLKSEKDRGGVDKPWDPIASLGVISLLLVTIYKCPTGTKVTNITKCKVVKVKGQHGGVVIAGDYATLNFHYHYPNRQD